ncbi:MAG: hypothetical protein CVU44_06165 [Chloroflexi bacterium HGW-Chloroflexi-6]|nr:MAG: hypothetical protein CVU44_06165 [Chloroflexi bacterium HGW-Chloroflexi-6]
MNSQSSSYPNESLKLLDDGVKALFDEMLLATQWQKPAYLMAVYRKSEEHIRAMDGLADKLLREGYSVCSVDTTEVGFDTFLRMVNADTEPEKKVYFIENLSFDEAQPKQASWQTFYFQRDSIDIRLAKMVFWLNEEQLVSIALNIPSYWENRYQVVDLVTTAAPQTEESWADSSELSSQADAQFSNVIDLAQTLLKECKENLRIGILDWRRGELDSAYQYLHNAVDLADVLGDASMQINCQKGLALVLIEMKNPAEAIEAYNKILELDPDSPLPWNNLGNLYHNLDDLQKAEESFLNALAHNSSNVVSWVGLAGVYEKMNMLQEALDSYRQALRLVPEFTLAWFRIGGVLQAVEQPENAVKAYEIVIRQSAKYIPAWLQLAKIFQAQGQSDRAVNTIQKALEHSPDSFDLWMELGNVSVKYNNRLAADAYRKALAIDPRHGQAYCRLAQVHEEQGNLLDSISCYEIGMNFIETDVERSKAWDALMSVMAKKEGFTPVSPARPGILADENLTYQPGGMPDFHAAASLTKKSERGQADAGEINREKPVVGFANTSRGFFAGSEFFQIPTQAESRRESSRQDFAELTLEINAPAWYANNKQLAQELHHARQVRLPRSQQEQIKLLTDAMLEQPRADFWQPHKKNRHRLGFSFFPKKQDKALAENALQADPAKAEGSQSFGRTDKGSRAWMRQGKHLLKRGFYEDAIAAFSNAVHAEPDLGIAYINMGIAYFLSSKYDRALVQFYKGLELTNDADEKSLAWNYVGDTYRRLHDSDNAMKAYQKISESRKSENVLRQRARRVLVFGNC